MPNSVQLRREIESTLSPGLSAALSPRVHTKPAQVMCGVDSVDAILHGGLSVGVMTEFVGVNCSGRTTIAMAYMAAIVQAGGVCAWIDVADTFDPESAAACGVDLERLLWVRCGEGHQAAQQAPPPAPYGAATVIANTPVSPRHTGGGSPHPRSEGRDMPQAVSALMAAHGGLYDKQARREKRAIGTPGVPNRPLSYRSEYREEQINADRLPPRRGDNLAMEPRCAEPQPRRAAGVPSKEGLLPTAADVFRTGTPSQKPWPVLDQALRATDLLLQGGGFSAIVLDLGSIAPETAWRIPLATWFRFRAACERTRVSLVLLTQHPCARSSAEVVVRLQSGAMEADNHVFTGIRYQSAMQRNRSHENDTRVVPIRKPPQSAAAGVWRSEVAWAQAK